LSFNGIQTPSHQIFHNVEDIPNSKLLDEFPLIVKPSREDASVGIENSSVVYTIDALKKQISKIIREYKQPVLVEQFIEGRELNVAILGNEEPIVLPISEIDFSLLPKNFPKIVTYKAKWVEDSVEYKGTNGKCPADLPLKIQDNVKSIAMRAFSIMNCRDYARVDIRLTSNGTPYVLEINPNPDISIDSGFARSARTFGLEYPQMICKITEVALKRAKVVQ
jgi:D-alanine-D-alanine ligase